MTRDSSDLNRALSWLGKTTLAVSAGDLLLRFQDLGYADVTIIRYVRSIAHFGEWLDGKDLAPSDFSEELVSDFLDQHLPRCQCRTRIDRDRKGVRAALGHLGGILRRSGLVPAVQDEQRLPADIQREVDRFDEHLSHARGAAAATRTCRRRYVGYFLVWRFGKAPVVPEDLSAQDIRRFLLDRSAVCGPGTVGVIATTLRSFLRYLVFRGHPVGHLINAVPGVAQWRKARLPQHLTIDQEERFLRGVDQTSALGRRDYAMFLLMCQLGLRVSDVAALTLDDIDWHTGTLAVRVGKSRRTHLVPLPTPVARAIVAYLRDGRPCSEDRHIFLRHRPPHGRATSTAVIRGAVRRAYKRSGLPSSWTGTHRLRHTAAARMLRRRATIKEIADVLGHRSIDTAAIYAKVDLEALREVVLPWPGRTA
ncbi:MAG: site-specific integrase [SAR202 cluster bacterium]|nr:site-specific integrase [SAR202 cluster bacterium]